MTEFRDLCLTADTHAFLHGLPTDVPGSWLQGAATCKNKGCQQLPERWAAMSRQGESWPRRQSMECAQCKSERKARQRVIPDGADASERLRKEGLHDAKVIVPNNDVRTEINKMHARQFARKVGCQLLWCKAEDKVSNEAMKYDPTLPSRKASWLQRHDRECGDLAGIVPLAKNLPMVLADHLDRDPERNLLRGTSCVIYDWVLGSEETAVGSANDEYMLQDMVTCVRVKFPDAKWKLHGMPRGVYPIRPA